MIKQKHDVPFPTNVKIVLHHKTRVTKFYSKLNMNSKFCDSFSFCGQNCKIKYILE